MFAENRGMVRDAGTRLVSGLLASWLRGFFTRGGELGVLMTRPWLRSLDSIHAQMVLVGLA